MTDQNETTMIECTHGPYRGSRLTVSKADAQSAISEGWAVDPFSEEYRKRNVADPHDAEGKPLEPPKQLTDEERAKVVEAAEKAACKLRGEDEAAEREKKEKAERERSMHPDQGGNYKTRGQNPKV